jgi:streptogramin lyase
VISSGYTGGGLDQPNGIAVDGSGTVWTTNYHGGSITELAGAATAKPGAILSPSAGFGTTANLVEPYAVAIDPSGNVWISNFATVPAPGKQGTITEFVGLATPVRTPLVGPVVLP